MRRPGHTQAVRNQDKRPLQAVARASPEETARLGGTTGWQEAAGAAHERVSVGSWLTLGRLGPPTRYTQGDRLQTPGPCVPRGCHTSAVHTAVTAGQRHAPLPHNGEGTSSPPSGEAGRAQMPWPSGTARGSAVQASAQWGNQEPPRTPHVPGVSAQLGLLPCRRSPRLWWVTSTERPRGHGWKREPGRPGGREPTAG